MNLKLTFLAITASVLVSAQVSAASHSNPGSQQGCPPVLPGWGNGGNLGSASQWPWYPGLPSANTMPNLGQQNTSGNHHSVWNGGMNQDNKYYEVGKSRPADRGSHSTYGGDLPRAGR